MISGSGTSYTIGYGSVKVGDVIEYNGKYAQVLTKDGSSITTDKTLSETTLNNKYGTVLSYYAYGANSHVGGDHTIAGYDNQTVVGKYNNNQEDTLFEVGNGDSSTNSNAFEVHSDGRATIGAQPTADMDVATKKYVDENGGGATNLLQTFDVTRLSTTQALSEVGTMTALDFIFNEIVSRYLAQPYSSSSTYNQNDIVFYRGDIYVCITAISTPEEFDSSKWSNVTNKLYEVMTQIELAVAQFQPFVEGITGDLEDLTTTDKTALVSAINEVNGKIGNINTVLSSLTTPSNNGGNN